MYIIIIIIIKYIIDINALLYYLETVSLYNYQLKSLDFVVNKYSRSSRISETVQFCSAQCATRPSR